MEQALDVATKAMYLRVGVASSKESFHLIADEDVEELFIEEPVFASRQRLEAG